MVFAVMNQNEAPVPVGGVATDLFNCSGSGRGFAKYEHMFRCNLAPNCLNNEDEADCDYVTSECGAGFVDIGESCLRFSGLKPAESYSKAGVCVGWWVGGVSVGGCGVCLCACVGGGVCVCEVCVWVCVCV
jgi:hypothetical protein